MAEITYSSMFIERSGIKLNRQSIPVFTDDEAENMVDQYWFDSKHKTHIQPRPMATPRPRPREDSPIPQRSMFVSNMMELSRSYDGDETYDGCDTQIDQYSLSTAPMLDMVPYISSTSDSCVLPSLPDEDQKHNDGYSDDEYYYSDHEYHSDNEYYPNDDDEEQDSESTQYEILKSQGPIPLDAAQITVLKENGLFLPITTDMDKDIDEDEDDRWDFTFLIDSKPHYYVPFKDWHSDV